MTAVFMGEEHPPVPKSSVVITNKPIIKIKYNLRISSSFFQLLFLRLKLPVSQSPMFTGEGGGGGLLFNFYCVRHVLRVWGDLRILTIFLSCQLLLCGSQNSLLTETNLFSLSITPSCQTGKMPMGCLMLCLPYFL